MEIAEYLRRDHGISLSLQQREAVEETHGHILLLAVPGAGKTTVLTARLANLIINQGADPARIAALTFNRESARDMTRRWGTLFGAICPAPAFSTIHSFCYGILREYAAGRGTRVPTLLEGEKGDGVGRVVTAIYRELTGNYLSEDRLSDLVSALGYCVNMCLEQPDPELQRLERAIPDLAAVRERYTAYKRERELMDFDDMLLFTHTALTRSQTLRERIRGRYDFILVDEAQDTSRIQHTILRRIVGDNLLMVGDEDQSIYGFRGAYPQGLLDFFKTYPDGKLLKLEQNYRSTGAIVESASRVIGQNQSRYAKEMRTDRPQGEAVQVLRDLTFEEEGGWILRLLGELPPDKTCAVLYRTGVSGIGISHLLRKEGVLYTAHPSGLGYAGDHINREILSIMALAADPSDVRAFGRCYYRLGCAIPKEVATQAMEQAQGDLLDWLIAYGDFPGKNTGRLSWTRRVLARMAGQRPLEQLSSIVQDLEYPASLERRGQSGYSIDSALQKLVLLSQLARDSATLEELNRRVAAAERMVAAGDSARIFLSTVHSAKGREFDWVVIADALEGIFPQVDAVEYSALSQRDSMEEETRLFYTAMTRARDRLWVLSPRTALGRPLDPSRFLDFLETDPGAAGEQRLHPGRRVNHAYFGMGEVLSVDPGRGLVKVRFSLNGVKTFTLESFSDQHIFHLL